MIEIPPASFQITPYGEVVSVALESLRENFDTSRLLQLVDRLNVCLADLGGIVAVRDDLLRLHAMSLTLVEGSALIVPTENACIWSEAETLQQDLEALSEWVQSAQNGIAPLLGLAPEHVL
ncbi:Tn3 family transposase post-transcriptional regulator TnpC [Pseudomonas sp. GD03696]|uniref:Tn3 family transposase post-transcriptional regulator TnpC n=1 Tax=Pseudomonas sp. GD03696 TaxID=2975368 RepID=UPI002448CF8A|nr:Tn3 family transposase post-transcriptional regulator TnpC [Pseudomonas sp. GD03696]MDH1932684.1 transposase [Pseudomonas sp. GD03696]